MRKLLIGLTALLLSGGAYAADLPLKDQAFRPLPAVGCGLYYGVNALGSAATINGAPAGSTAIGGDVGGTLGYTCTPTAGTIWFVEAQADFQNLNGGSNGFALTGPAHLEQRAGFGGPLNAFLNFLPNLNLPSVPSLPGLPAGATISTTVGYAYMALNEDDISAQLGLASNRQWLISPEAGVGMWNRLSNNVVADVWAGAKFQSQAICLGGAVCPKLNTGLVTGVSFKY
jgi:hypothetical protein